MSKVGWRTIRESEEHNGVAITQGDKEAAVRSPSELRDPFFSKMPRTTLGPTHQRFYGVKWSYETNHLPPSVDEINRTFSYTFTLLICLSGVGRDNFNFTFHDGMFFNKRGVSLLWRSWLMHCATYRKFAGSIPDGVTIIFHWHNPSGPYCGPGVDSASNIYEYQEYILGGKCGRYIGLTTLLPSCADCHEIWEPQPPEILRAFLLIEF